MGEATKVRTIAEAPNSRHILNLHSGFEKNFFKKEEGKKKPVSLMNVHNEAKINY